MLSADASKVIKAVKVAKAVEGSLLGDHRGLWRSARQQRSLIIID